MVRNQMHPLRIKRIQDPSMSGEPHRIKAIQNYDDDTTSLINQSNKEAASRLFIIHKLRYQQMWPGTSSKFLSHSPHISINMLLIFYFSLTLICCQVNKIIYQGQQLPQAVVGVQYSYSFSHHLSDFVKQNYQLRNLSALPIGFMLNGIVLIGIPQFNGEYSIVLALVNFTRNTTFSKQVFTLNVGSMFTRDILPNTFVNVPFRYNITFIGGIPPFKWGYTSGSHWIKFNKSVISGIPDKIEDTTFAIAVIDANNNTFNSVWRLSTIPNQLELLPVTLYAEVHTLAETNFTMPQGKSPFTFQFLNLPEFVKVSNNSFRIVNPTSTSDFFVGVFLTDSNNITNYFNLSIHIQDSFSKFRKMAGDKLLGVSESTTINGVLPRVFYQVSMGLQIPSDRGIVFNYSREVNSSSLPSKNSYIKNAATVNNKNPCREDSGVIQASGAVSIVSYSNSSITLTNRVVLVFQNCTTQAFRGNSKEFDYGDFVTYMGSRGNNRIELISITNTS